jgi:predicted O-methyltransferase YrrM
MANDPKWTAVDGYINGLLNSPDSSLDAALADSEAAGLPSINVAANQGKFLHLLARLAGAKRILEIGTLGGYSTIWLARALPPDGKLITLEADPNHAKVARSNLARAGVAERVQLYFGKALETLPSLAGDAPFDFIFVDADKQNNAAYLDWAIRLSRPGSVIIVDNVIRSGDIVDANSSDDRVTGTRRFFEAFAKDKRVTGTAIQTVGAKGYDGFAIAIVNESYA